MINFEVNTDDFKEASKGYDMDLEDMNAIKTDIKNCLDRLKNEGWNSKAGEAFVNKYDDNWCENIQKYMNLVEFLSTTLKEASVELSDLVEEVKKLQYKD